MDGFSVAVDTLFTRITWMKERPQFGKVAPAAADEGVRRAGFDHLRVRLIFDILEINTH